MSKTQGEGVGCEWSESRFRSKTEDLVLREDSLAGVVDSVSDELGLEVEIGLGASVEPPVGGAAGVSRGEEDDVEFEALDTSPSDVEGVGERMTLVVLEHASSTLGTLPDPEHTPDTPSPGATP